ncbi:hypothetical protein, partial [Candidatus Viridilinea mediisalina]|uniref:hypothetical protein n=1 Tax=Candidatus Viridilinea mediisalina TaxID=2024553 RepID=UPI0010562CEA
MGVSVLDHAEQTSSILLGKRMLLITPLLCHPEYSMARGPVACEKQGECAAPLRWLSLSKPAEGRGGAGLRQAQPPRHRATAPPRHRATAPPRH